MRQLAYVIPTIYLVVVFTVFQVINISAERRDPNELPPAAPTCAFVLTLPLSAAGIPLKGALKYLPMVVGAPLNAAILYFILRGKTRR